jgi:hypothetical protein
MQINVFGFLKESPSDRGTYEVHVTLKALQTVGISRITVLFNRQGGNGSYQLAAYASSRQMLQGEEMDLVLLHYRQNIGTFWGDLDRVTECNSLDHLNKDERGNHLRRNLFADGPYYCQIVIQHTRGEERLNFTVLVPTASERPRVVTGGADHKNYDPNRLISATGTFLS